MTTTCIRNIRFLQQDKLGEGTVLVRDGRLVSVHDKSESKPLNVKRKGHAERTVPASSGERRSGVRTLLKRKPQGEQKGKMAMYEHMVSFKFKQKPDPAFEQKLVAALRSFKGRIPGIVEVTAGVNVTEETHNRHGFSLGLRVTFTDQEALRAYGPHPVHREFVGMLDGLVEQVVVVDYPIES